MIVFIFSPADGIRINRSPHGGFETAFRRAVSLQPVVETARDYHIVVLALPACRTIATRHSSLLFE
jgi:hypothetical protein